MTDVSDQTCEEKNALKNRRSQASTLFRSCAVRARVALPEGCSVAAVCLMQDMARRGSVPMATSASMHRPKGVVSPHVAMGAVIKAGLARFVRDDKCYVLTDSGHALLQAMERADLLSVAERVERWIQTGEGGNAANVQTRMTNDGRAKARTTNEEGGAA